MDRATNQRLRQLDRRLQHVYREAGETAIRNNEKAIERLAAFMERDNSGLTPEQLRTAQINYTRQVERTTGIMRSISDDLANSGRRAAQMIQGESLNIYEFGYRNSLTSINRQLGFSVDWSIYDRNQLRVLMMGEERSPFTQVAYNRLGQNRRIVHLLQNQLAQSVMLGEGIPQITRRIMNIAGITELHRARTIARTEMLRSANQGRMLGFKQAHEEYDIPMLKKWLAAIDDRTRDSHAGIDGEKRELDEKFSNGLLQPHDPAGPPEETINCRCTVTSVLKGFDFAEKQELQEKIGKKDLQTGLSSGKIGDADAYTEITGKKAININDNGAVSKELSRFREEFSNADVEHALAISPNGNAYSFRGNEVAVNPGIVGQSELNGSIIIHNHVVKDGELIGDSFSLHDLRFAAENKTGFQHLVSGERNDAFELTREISESELNAAWESAKSKMLERAEKGELIINWEQEEILKILNDDLEGFSFYENI